MDVEYDSTTPMEKHPSGDDTSEAHDPRGAGGHDGWITPRAGQQLVAKFDELVGITATWT